MAKALAVGFMASSLVSLICTASVIACPFVCRFDECCSSAPQPTMKHHCCDSCSHKSESTLPVSPGQDTAPENWGQCLCCGAIIEVGGSQHLQADSQSWALAVPADDSLTVGLHATYAAELRPPLPDDGANFGSALRCRLMSLLC
jgi:hypothetical protein